MSLGQDNSVCLSQRDLNSGTSQFETGVLTTTAPLLLYAYTRVLCMIIFMKKVSLGVSSRDYKYEDSSVLGCDAVPDKLFPTFRRMAVTSSSWSSRPNLETSGTTGRTTQLYI
jgi:hypothetical protein